MKKFYTISTLCVAMMAVAMPSFADAPAVATFEDFTFTDEAVYWAGDENGEEWYWGMGYDQDIVSGGYSFRNCCMPSWYSWVGYAVSRSTSTAFDNANYTADQFNCCVGHGVDGSDVFGVAYPDGTMWGEDFPVTVVDGPAVVPGFYITNDAWDVYAFEYGDGITDGGFTVGDYFKVLIHAFDAEGNEIGTRSYCLADYRFENEAERYIVKDWEYVDLSQLGEASYFTFTFEGSRSNAYGLTTPTYFCFDDFGAEGTEIEREEGTYTGSTDGINSISSEAAPDVIYTIDGIRVKDASRPGLYIINGKKVLVK